MKKFWLTVAHAAVMGVGITGVIFFPAAAPLILPTAGTLNALIPSPLSKVSFDIETGKNIDTTKITAQKESPK